ncbi:membrane-fusion protein (plasmid) [Asticcacaulis excentricus]|uniref:Membrane-fusion protein n=1 Tax=Asticcacaulis excentricus TaxID=78587 RepID=A0A3G9G7K5_9CAUL|nr:membrane-fusion protein [Asticcacaulis excentricus]
MILSVGGRWTIFGFFLSATVLCSALFGSMATFSRKESVIGWLVPIGGISRLSAEQAGVVEDVLVNEGDPVRAGEAILTVKSSTDSDSENALTRRVSLKKMEADAFDFAEKARYEQLKALIGGLYAKKEMLVEQRNYVKENLSLFSRKEQISFSELEKNKKLLEKGYISSSRLNELENNYLSAKESYASYNSQLMVLEQQIQAAESEIESSNAKLKEQGQVANISRINNKQQINEIFDSGKYVIKSPINGRASIILVERGQYMNEGMTAVVMVPENGALFAEMFVTSEAAGFIKVGQNVSLKYSAFPYQKFGTGHGTIISVSNTVIAPSEINAPGVKIDSPVFKVRAKLKDGFVKAYNEKIPLQPGMHFTAEIIIDKRSIWEWIMDPIFAAGRLAK